MAKTLFSDGNPLQGILGTIVSAAFLNKIFSHRHDGLDQDGSAPLDYAADTGAANAYAIALVPALTAHVVGLPIHFKATNANTAASTLAVNGLDAVAIKQVDGSNLPAGAILAGQMITVMYTGTFYALMSSTITPSMFMRTLLDDADAATARATLGALGLPDFTGTNQGLAHTGYQKLPGGLIIQWGWGSTTIGPTSTLRIYFPISYTGDIGHTGFEIVTTGGPNNACFAPFVVADQSGSFVVTNTDPDTSITQYRWFSIGW